MFVLANYDLTRTTFTSERWPSALMLICSSTGAVAQATKAAFRRRLFEGERGAVSRCRVSAGLGERLPPSLAAWRSRHLGEGMVIAAHADVFEVTV